jgi:hypothetical protein
LCDQNSSFLNLHFRGTELCLWAQHTTKKYIVYCIFTKEKIVLLSHRFFAINFRLFWFKPPLHTYYSLFQTLLLVLLILILLLLSIIFIASGVSDMGAFKKKPYYTFWYSSRSKLRSDILFISRFSFDPYTKPSLTKNK